MGELTMFKVTLQKPKALANVSLSRQDMIKVAAKAMETINRRLDSGLGINDRRMKPLSPQWAAAKKKLGQPAIRNLQFSGAMRGALTPVEISENRVVLGYTRRSEEAKALANQNRAPWFGLSPNDEAVVGRYAAQLMKKKT